MAPREQVPRLHDGHVEGIEIVSRDLVVIRVAEVGGRKWQCVLTGGVNFRCVDLGVSNIIFEVTITPASKCDREVFEWMERQEGCDPALFNTKPDFLNYVDSERASDRWVLEICPSQGCVIVAVCNEITWKRVEAPKC